MRVRQVLLGSVFFAAAGFGAAPAFAADIAFSATLSGDVPTTKTGSKATGSASITVHTEAQTVDMLLTVKGITPANFADHLEHAPVGPVHLHQYLANGNSTLLLPFPMGSSYAATTDGFTLTVKNYSYAEGAKILKSTATFDEFLGVMKSGAVVVNIHTDAFKDGEISGAVGVSK